MLKQLGMNTQSNIKLAKGKGCESCYDSGFKGRLGIYELVELNQDLQKLILANPSGEQLRDFIAQQNIPTIVSEGIEKVTEGITTLEEVNRAIHTED